MGEHLVPRRLARGSRPPSDREWLVEAARIHFPKLRIALGDASFNEVLVEHHRFSIGETAMDLPDFLLGSPRYPLWCAELAALDRARGYVLSLPEVPTLNRRDVRLDRKLVLIPAYAQIEVTTSADELWLALDEGRHSRPPHSLGESRTVVIWRATHLAGSCRTVARDEAAALELAARGTTIIELARAFSTHARAIDAVLRWIDAGLLAAR